MKRLLVVFLLILSLSGYSYAQQSLYRFDAPQYVGAFKYYDYIVPAYVSGGYSLYFTKNVFSFTRGSSEIKFIDHLNIDSKSNLSEFYIQANVGRVAARYYYILPKTFSGAGILSRDQYEITTTSGSTISSSTTQSTSLNTSFDGRISFSRFEFGVPLFITRLGATVEPFFVSEWVPRSFNLTSASASTSNLTNLLLLNNAFNAGESSVLGVGISYTQRISNLNDFYIKYSKVYSQLSNNSLFDIKTSIHLNQSQDRLIPSSYVGAGYTWRTYSFSSHLGQLQFSYTGPYLELGLQF